jgi:hypothetical protein
VGAALLPAGACRTGHSHHGRAAGALGRVQVGAGRILGHGHLQLDAFQLWADIDRQQLRGRSDQALAERKAQREVLQVAGRGHHHGEGGAVVAQRHRHFLGHHVDLLLPSLRQRCNGRWAVPAGGVCGGVESGMQRVRTREIRRWWTTHGIENSAVAMR